MSVFNRLLGNVIPQISFCGHPAKVEGIDFQQSHAVVTIVVESGQRFAITVNTPNIVELK